MGTRVTYEERFDWSPLFGHKHDFFVATKVAHHHGLSRHVDKGRNLHAAPPRGSGPHRTDVVVHGHAAIPSNDGFGVGTVHQVRVSGQIVAYLFAQCRRILAYQVTEGLKQARHFN